MKLINLFIVGCLFLGLAACGGGNDDPEAPTPEPTPTPNPSPSPTPDPTPDNTVSFYKGADISWVTEMEKGGKKFYNASGKETGCFELMKELGMNAIRLRVWVNPEKAYGDYCNQADVVAKAKRAKEAGMEVMIDFHYSDFFADPSRQTKPAAWEGKSLAELKTAVTDHTTTVLKAIKEVGVTPKWIQIGNETRNGMLWPEGQLWTNNGDIANGWKNYADLSNAGYDAAKAVFGDAIVMVHQNNAWEDLDWWFKNFKAAGGKFDMIGLSHYPQSESDKTWQTVNQEALKHIKSLSNTYKCKVMICEIGVKTQANETLAAQVLSEFMTEAKKIEACAGIFYWEPQAYGGWKPVYYTTLKWNAYDMGAFTSAGKPSKVMDAFKD